MAGTQNVAYFRKPTSLGEWAPDLSLPASLPGRIVAGELSTLFTALSEATVR